MLLSLVQPPHRGIVCSDMSRSPDERLDTRGGRDPPCPHTPSGKEPARGRARRRLRFLRHRRADERQQGSRGADRGRPLLPLLHAVGGRTHRGGNYPAPTAGRQFSGDSWETTRSAVVDVTGRSGEPPSLPRRHPRDTPENATPSTSGAVLATRPASIFADRSSTVPGTGWARGGGRRARGSGTGHASSRKQGATQHFPHPQESTIHVFAPTAHTAGRRLPGVPRRGHLHHLAQRR